MVFIVIVIFHISGRRTALSFVSITVNCQLCIVHNNQITSTCFVRNLQQARRFFLSVLYIVRAWQSSYTVGTVKLATELDSRQVFYN